MGCKPCPCGTGGVLRQVVDEMRAADLADLRQLLFFRLVEMDVVGCQADPRRIVESVRGKKVAGGLVQVVPWAEKRVTRAVADDEHFPADLAAAAGRMWAAGAAVVGVCCGGSPEHVRAIADVAAELSPD